MGPHLCHGSPNGKATHHKSAQSQTKRTHETCRVKQTDNQNNKKKKEKKKKTRRREPRKRATDEEWCHRASSPSNEPSCISKPFSGPKPFATSFSFVPRTNSGGSQRFNETCLRHFFFWMCPACQTRNTELCRQYWLEKDERKTKFPGNLHWKVFFRLWSDINPGRLVASHLFFMLYGWNKRWPRVFFFWRSYFYVIHLNCQLF